VIAIVDYDAGNLHSVTKAVEAVGLRCRVTASPREIEAADGVILPGVGAFGPCSRRLQERGLTAVLRDYVRADRPFLGICLGLQLLFDWGEEGAGAPGLAALPGRVVRLEAAPGRKIPHMGWNALRFRRRSPLFAEIAEGEYFYFVHSFQAVAEHPEDLVATVGYGSDVTAAVGRGRVHAVQFHPEKSSTAGLRLLRNFGRIVAAGG